MTEANKRFRTGCNEKGFLYTTGQNGNLMAIRNGRFDSMTEPCEDCGRDTEHRVSVEIRTESTKTENAAFSREPYRITRCLVCNRERSQRMNNA